MGDPYVMVQLVPLGFSGISPKVKLLIKRYALIWGLQVVVPEPLKEVSFLKNIPLGTRLPKEVERKFSLHLYRG